MNAWITGEEFRDNVKSIYVSLWEAGLITKSADTIPYTEDFERLFVRVSSVHSVTKNEVFRALMALRKDGELPGPRKEAREDRPLLSHAT